MIDQVSSCAREWFSKVNENDPIIDRMYLFGSLVNHNGEQFFPHGVKTSDIDLLVRFDPVTVSDANRRAEALRIMQDNVCDFESSIAGVLGRSCDYSSANLSILPVTWYEIYHCIHKGYDPKLYSTNIFYDVTTNDRKSGLSNYIDKLYHFNNIEAFGVMRLCQKLRNDFLTVSGDGIYNIPDFSETAFGSIPKELMRAGALLKYIDDGSKNFDDRTDLIAGEAYVVSLIKGAAENNDAVNELLQKVKKRRNVLVYRKPSLLNHEIILLSEILFDKARSIIHPSIKETIDKIIRRKKGKLIYK